MAKSIEIVVPEFAQDIKLAEHIASTNYHYGDPLPDKFFVSSTSSKLKSNFAWNNKRLYDKKTGKYVVKNLSTAGKPRIKPIAGNDIWGRVHERIRMAVVDAIKHSVRPFLPRELGLIFPLLMDIEVHTTVKLGNWDIGNLWVYDKVIEDLLVDEKLLPDDNIRYITKAGGARFIPVGNEKERKLVIRLTEDEDPRIKHHVLYDLHNIKKYENMPSFVSLQNIVWKNVLVISLVKEGKPGTVFTLLESDSLQISSGRKKMIFGAIRKGLQSCYSVAIQQDSYVALSRTLFNMIGNFVEDELRRKGITVYIYDEGGPEIPVYSQDGSV